MIIKEFHNIDYYYNLHETFIDFQELKVCMFARGAVRTITAIPNTWRACFRLMATGS